MLAVPTADQQRRYRRRIVDQQLATGPTAAFHALTDMLRAAMPPVHAVALGAAGDVHFDDSGDHLKQGPRGPEDEEEGVFITKR